MIADSVFLMSLRAENIELGTHCESRGYHVGVSRSKRSDDGVDVAYDQENRTTYKFVTFTDIYRIDLDLPLDFKSESDFTVDSRDGVEVCEGPGILHNSKICRLHGR